MKRFSNEEIRLLAESERAMDAGEIPFVIYHGQRASVQKPVMDQLGLVQGQTINDEIFGAMLRANIDDLRQKIAEESTAAALDRARPSKQKGN